MSEMGGGDFGGGGAGSDAGGGDFGGSDVSANDFGEVSDGGDFGTDSGGSDFSEPIVEAPVAEDAGSWAEEDSSVEGGEALTQDPAADTATDDSSIVTVQADQASFGAEGIPSDIRNIQGGDLSNVFNRNADDPRGGDTKSGEADPPPSTDLTPGLDDGPKAPIYRGPGGPT